MRVTFPWNWQFDKHCEFQIQWLWIRHGYSFVNALDAKQTDWTEKGFHLKNADSEMRWDCRYFPFLPSWLSIRPRARHLRYVLLTVRLGNSLHNDPKALPGLKSAITVRNASSHTMWLLVSAGGRCLHQRTQRVGRVTGGWPAGEPEGSKGGGHGVPMSGLGRALCRELVFRAVY